MLAWDQRKVVAFTALTRYKELAKVGKEKTNFPTRRAIDIMAKTLRAQLVIIGTGHRVLEDL